MIQKIISYAFLEINQKELDIKVTKHCIKYTNSLMKVFMEEDFFRYERDDILEAEKKRKRFFYDTVYLGENKWDEIEEPVSFVINLRKNHLRTELHVH
jgi:hypothetical protein